MKQHTLDCSLQVHHGQTLATKFRDVRETVTSRATAAHHVLGCGSERQPPHADNDLSSASQELVRVFVGS